MREEVLDLAGEDRFCEIRPGQSLCYRRYGGGGRESVLLIAGLGLQLLSWPLPLITALTRAGFDVVSFDNRDAGRSFRAATPTPGKGALLLRRLPAGLYRIEDMACDTAHLITALGLGAVHVVGMSMGGMIAQALAAHHPEKVASLTSIFSTTGHPRRGQPAWSTILRLALAPAPRNEAEAVADFVRLMRHIGDPKVEGSEAEWRAYAEAAFRRGAGAADRSGFLRQIGAILASGDRTAALGAIRAPTLVIHGDRDRMVHPSGGAATAAAIPGAFHVVIPGLRHQIDGRHLPLLVRLLLGHFLFPRGAEEEARRRDFF
jgi:pimeloyl-ACP methyl ester carboxylesterase